jgi:EpsI family protein
MNNYHYITACLILILAGLFVNDRVKETTTLTSPSVMDIPFDLNEYYGEDIKPLYGYYYDNPQADEKILRVYKNKKDNKELYVFIGHWNNQNEEKRIVPPRYTADGWSYYWIKKRVLSTGLTTINLKKFLNEKGPRKELVYYCYIMNDNTFSSEYKLKIMSMLNLLLRGRNSAALLRVAMPVTDEWPAEKAEVYEESFIRRIAPLLIENF